MTAQVIRLAAYRDLTPELAATHRRLERLQRAKDAALLSLQADLEDEVSRVGLTPGAVQNEARRIEQEIVTVRNTPLTRFAP